jgi:hypothetical protein
MWHYLPIVGSRSGCIRFFRLKKKHKMKETELNFKEKTEISVQQKKQVEKELVGVLKPHSGHSVFEINLETLVIEKAKFTEYTFVIGQNHNNHELIVKGGYAYVCALNEKNALKKYLKGDNGSKGSKNPLKLNIFGL